MELYSTNHTSPNVNLKEAVFKGLPDDNGLFMPTVIPRLEQSFLDNIENYSFQVIAFEICRTLMQGEVPDKDLEEIINDSMNMEAPLVPVTQDMLCLELFHGPSLAFKDFGARFMARLMSYFLQKEQKEINILVATSGDTGSAVAQGFYKAPGIKVTILYPKGKVSLNQEKQLTTLGENITALEVDGVFDDCQHLVKSAFLDQELNKKMNLSSANSINIARLIPQSFYYMNTYARLKKEGRPLVFSVPSGNFGNLCGGLIAREMGMPVEKFVAATNVNDIVPEYIKSGLFNPRPSVQTLSNAMDVGNPSNFPRLLAMHDGNYDKMKSAIDGRAYNDDITLYAIKKVYDETGYTMCPHTAVAFLGLTDYLKETGSNALGVFLSTAHPSKFKDTVEDTIGKPVDMPERLQKIIEREKHSIPMGKDVEGFKEWLLNNR